MAVLQPLVKFARVLHAKWCIVLPIARLTSHLCMVLYITKSEVLREVVEVLVKVQAIAEEVVEELVKGQAIAAVEVEAEVVVHFQSLFVSNRV